MNQVCEPKNCTGCWVCVNTCPKHSISMSVGALGHLFPKIDASTCVDCGLCQKACPANHPVKKTLPIHTYAAWAKDDEEYKTSTSGGIGSVLARNVIRNGGIVYGCAFLKDFDVRHVRVDNEDDLVLLKGSKYVQSSIKDTYCKVKEDLQSTLKVLFIGTPCQVAGLKNYLRKDYENLYTVDLICHGVPSIEFLRQHVKEKTGSTTVDYVRFRDENTDYVMSVIDNGVESYKRNLWQERYHDEFFNAFIDGYASRDSCHSCRYAGKERTSDITIGDFWGLNDDLPLEHKNGISCVLVNTEHGQSLFDSVRPVLNCFERELEEAVKGNDQLRAPKRVSWRASLFKSLSNIMSLSQAYRVAEFDHRHGIQDNSIVRHIRLYIKELVK